MRVVSADVASSIASDTISNVERTKDLQQTTETAKTESPFASLVSHAVNEASALDATAGKKVDALASGASDDIHGTMIAAKEAEISVKLLGTIRNQLLDAFHEIWRTSV